ncbi:hypothetical protein QUW56_12005 [Phocaeicola barnesiae]|uniref:hypothetical protein n=1 Tax=Phocaeicola barnesiae TaxID=376804 RepID=UPI0025A3D86C|nr:hypothetical protein [Phocaeicola barnesiae]MDM8234084.1 hypothetical protein [Phocaeicola barnesiae]
MKLSENLKTNLFAFLGAFVCVAIFISFDKCSQEDSSNDTNSYYENNAGSDNESNSESNTVSLLKTWALQSEYLDYDDVSIREVKKLPEDSDFDYKIFADIEQGSIKCTIYLFVKLNSSETKMLRVYKDDSELRKSLIDDVKSRHPDWDM